jgi:uncharacterized protein (TIGR00296 family)
LETNQVHIGKSTRIEKQAILNPLTIDQGILLVKAARNAISGHFSEQPIGQITNIAELPKKRGIFVSLFNISNGRVLRGCIGELFGEGSLIETVQHVAIEAASNDYRFEPISSTEFNKQVIVEVNLLSPIQLITVKNPVDYVANILVGRDGLIVDSTGYRGLLLPQVALEENFDAEEFLCHCCLKAGLPPDTWLTGNVQISKFQSQIFEEQSPNGLIVEKNMDLSTK